MQFFYDIFQRFLITKTSVGALTKLSMYNHRIIIQAGTTCKKIYCVCVAQLPGGILLKMLKYFDAMLNSFEFSLVKAVVES